MKTNKVGDGENVKYSNLLYKHQWNTKFAFAGKLDIFICENNMLSSHVKISPLLWLHNKPHLSDQKTLSKMVWHFIGVYIINRTLHGRLEIRNFSSRVEKNISLVRCVHSWNIFQHSKRNCVSPRGHVISSMYSCSFRVTDAPYTTTIDLMNIDECNCLIFGLSFLNARGVACGLTTHTI